VPHRQQMAAKTQALHAIRIQCNQFRFHATKVNTDSHAAYHCLKRPLLQQCAAL